MKRLSGKAGLVVFAALLAGCNTNYQLRSGQVVSVEEGPHCYVTVQDPDPIVMVGPSRFEVRCGDAAGVLPGEKWPPR